MAEFCLTKWLHTTSVFSCPDTWGRWHISVSHRGRASKRGAYTHWGAEKIHTTGPHAAPKAHEWVWSLAIPLAARSSRSTLEGSRAASNTKRGDRGDLVHSVLATQRREECTRFGWLRGGGGSFEPLYFDTIISELLVESMVIRTGGWLVFCCYCFVFFFQFHKNIHAVKIKLMHL